MTRYCYFISSILLTSILPTSAYAQTIPSNVDRQTERIQEREAERQRERDRQFEQLQSTPPSGAEVETQAVQPTDDGRCVAISHVKFSGMTRYRESDFSIEKGALIGDCVTITNINDALRIITNRYISDGYITSRATVGPQDLKDGTLEIVVLEGELTGVKDADDQSGYGPTTLGFAFPALEGQLLNLRDLEQGVDQLARLGSAEPSIDIEPGAEPGASVVRVSRARLARQFRPALSISNDGSASTGRWLSNFSVDADNILGLADFWSVYYSPTLESEPYSGGEGVGGFVSIPYGYWTLSLNAGRYKYESVLSGNEQSFASTGRSYNGSSSLDRLLYRDSDTKVSVSATLALLDTENRIQGIRLATSSYRLATGAIDWKVQQKIGGGLLSGNFGLTRGFDILGASAANTGVNGPRLSFRKIEASLTYQKPFAIGAKKFDYLGMVRAQSALDPVFSAHRFGLGGSSTVRGFRDDGISGRHGMLMRQQIGFPILKTEVDSHGLHNEMSGFVAYDLGGIFKRNDDPYERGVLSSTTVGMRIRNRHIQAELAVSKPLSAPSFVRHQDVEVSANIRLAI